MSETKQRMAIGIVLLKNMESTSAEKIVDALVRKWPELEPTVEDDDEVTLSISTTLGSLIAGRMAGPFPWPDLEGPCNEGTFWPTAAEDVKSHQSHLVLTVVDEGLSPIEKYSLLTRFAAATMVVCPSALGIYLGHAGLVLPKELFISFTLEVLPTEVPLHIWIRFYVEWDDERRSSSGCTQGMRAFGHREIEAIGSPETPAELGKRFEGLAEYILEGAIIRDGETIGVDERERIEIRFGTSRFGHEETIMKLIYD